MEFTSMMATAEEKALVPVKEKRGNHIFSYEVEHTRINAMVFFDTSGMNAHVNLIIRPNGGRKFVMELSDTDADCGFFLHLLQDAYAHAPFTDSFYQKFEVLVSRWLKIIQLLNALSRVQTKNASYLDALCNVLEIPDSRDKEKDCTERLMNWLESYDEFQAFRS